MSSVEYRKEIYEHARRVQRKNRMPLSRPRVIPYMWQLAIKMLDMKAERYFFSKKPSQRAIWFNEMMIFLNIWLGLNFNTVLTRYSFLTTNMAKDLTKPIIHYVTQRQSLIDDDPIFCEIVISWHNHTLSRIQLRIILSNWAIFRRRRHNSLPIHSHSQRLNIISRLPRVVIGELAQQLVHHLPKEPFDVGE